MKQQLYKKIAEEQTARQKDGKKMSELELQELADDLVQGNKVNKDRGLFEGFTNLELSPIGAYTGLTKMGYNIYKNITTPDEIPIFQVTYDDLPDADRQKIISEMQKQKMVPTKERILRAWRNHKLKEIEAGNEIDAR